MLIPDGFIGLKPAFKQFTCLVHTLRVIQAAGQWQDRWPEPSLRHRAVVGPGLLVNHSTEKSQDVRLQNSPPNTLPHIKKENCIAHQCQHINHSVIVVVSPYSQIFYKLDLLPFFHHLVKGLQVAQPLEKRDYVCLHRQVTYQVQSCVKL